jgi:hypothetical protein
MIDKPHAMKPLKLRRLTGRHLLLWIEEEGQGRSIVPAMCRAWLANLDGTAWDLMPTKQWHNTEGLEDVLSACCAEKGETTIWLPRGWSDLVLSGLTELMDSKAITWRYANLGGANCLIRGTWRGRKIIITSYGNWCGGTWDSWDGLENDPGVQRLMTSLGAEHSELAVKMSKGEVRALHILATLVQTSAVLSLPRLAATSAAAGLLCWRGWMGPVVQVSREKGAKTSVSKELAVGEWVGPLPQRPRRAIEAERHVCYGLVTRQLRQGKVEGPIYCLDVRNAYLLGIITTPLPIMYHRSINKPANEELAEALSGHTGLALVRVQSNDVAYPCRVNRKVVPAVGRYWTWLAGTELADALFRGAVQEVWTAHLWYASFLPEHSETLVRNLSASLSKELHPAIACGWRACYSSLVGRFAGWRHVWKDTTRQTNFGSWSTWEQADPETGEIVPWRSIAGHVQYLKEKSDKTDSVPLMYGAVTSHVRYIVNSLFTIAGRDNVVALHCDSLWCTAAGWQRLQKRASEVGESPDLLRCKDIFDRLWMNGKAICVSERHGKRVLHMPGVANSRILDPDGKLVLTALEPWNHTGTLDAAHGVKRRHIRYDAQKIVDKYSHEAHTIAFADLVDDPLLGESLLQPIRGRRSIDDD